jgi:hypothetical protein
MTIIQFQFALFTIDKDLCIFALKMAGSGNENGRELPRIWPARAFNLAGIRI